MPRVDSRFITEQATKLHNRFVEGHSFKDWAEAANIDPEAIDFQVARELARGTIELADVGVNLFQLGYEVCRAQEANDDWLQEALEALDEIAARPTSQRNPDGDEQAAHTMALLAREHAKRIREGRYLSDEEHRERKRAEADEALKQLRKQRATGDGRR